MPRRACSSAAAADSSGLADLAGIFWTAPDGDPGAFPAQSDTIKFMPLHFGNLQALRPDERPCPL